MTDGGPLRRLIDACLTPTIPSHLTAAFGDRTRQARSAERLVGALLARRAADRALAGHVFTWTRAGRLLVRRAP